MPVCFKKKHFLYPKVYPKSYPITAVLCYIVVFLGRCVKSFCHFFIKPGQAPELAVPFVPKSLVLEAEEHDCLEIFNNMSIFATYCCKILAVHPQTDS